MITQIFDYGWGPEWPTKIIEKEILDLYLSPIVNSQKQVVMINSTWYGQYQHAKTLRWLRNNQWDAIVLISMIDSAIPNSSWFAEFQKPVFEIGAYDSEHYIDFWAEVAARYIDPYPYHQIDIPFMCLNRKPHWHRLRLYREMENAGILDLGLVSLGGDGTNPAVRELSESVKDNMLAPNGQKIHHGIPNDITSIGDPENWERHFLNIVTETVYDINTNHFVSEKIFKPILGCRPFLVYDSDGATTWLTKNGFESYVDDFKDITLLDLRYPENMVPFLSVLCQQPSDYWKQKYLDLLPKIQYNLKRFNERILEQRERIKKGIQCQI